MTGRWKRGQRGGVCSASPAADVAAPSGACFAAATTARTHVRAADWGGPPACDHHRPSPATITAAPEGASPPLPHNAKTTHRAQRHGVRGQKRAAASSHGGWWEGEGKRGSARHQSGDQRQRREGGARRHAPRPPPPLTPPVVTAAATTSSVRQRPSGVGRRQGGRGEWGRGGGGGQTPARCQRGDARPCAWPPSQTVAASGVAGGGGAEGRGGRAVRPRTWSEQRPRGDPPRWSPSGGEAGRNKEWVVGPMGWSGGRGWVRGAGGGHVRQGKRQENKCGPVVAVVGRQPFADDSAKSGDRSG